MASLLLRIYSYQFGTNLIAAMKWHRPLPTMRHKVKLDPKETDLEIFSRMPLQDVWPDAQLFQVYQYLRNGIPKIPTGWEETISQLDAELASMGYHL